MLRQEGELLAQLQSLSAITLHLIGENAHRAVVERLAGVVFGSSAYAFHPTREPLADDGWPAQFERENGEFSYFSFSRLLALHHQHALVPRLQWSSSLQERAHRVRAGFTGQLVCVHLRSVAPFRPEESNADGPTWSAFFDAHARAGTRDFLLLGDDPSPPDFTPPSAGVTRATDLGLDLATQLALVGHADGFLGMASGLCTAANFSRVPHVLFKHPAHHPAAMARELGTADRFPFAGPRQRLWRRQATFDALCEALVLILS